METKYLFRKRLEKVHSFSRDYSVKQRRNEIVVDASWEIVVSDKAGIVIRTLADDLQEYFQTAMKIKIGIKAIKFPDTAIFKERKIIIGLCKDFPDFQTDHECMISCRHENILISGKSEKDAARGSYKLESIFNFRKGPFIKKGKIFLENRFSPRMIHSGWDLDVYPENYLRKAAHEGFDSILVFYRRKDTDSPGRITEINNLIRRAGTFGIGVYLYFQNYRDYDTMHPEDAGAEKYYEDFYGKAFRNHPGASGCVLVGESCAFPSRDPDVKSIREHDSGDNSKPHPGWWPCIDYPQWLCLVKKVITKHNAKADIVFWTYNWGWAPEDKRLELIKNLPSGISLLVTFEMFECVTKGKVLEHCADYTIKIKGPGKYFISEAEIARKRGIRLYAMSNTGGMTWDFGVLPYIPVPFQWAGRWRKLLEARERWGLAGLMESHHYGWYPSYVSRFGQYFAQATDTKHSGKFLMDAAQSDFGTETARHLIKAWRIWSKAIPLLPATAYDQYGPLRVGPSYPLHFSETNAPCLPSDPGVIHGSRIIMPLYSPDNCFTRGPHNKIPICLRVNHEIRSVKKLIKRWQDGLNKLETGLSTVPENGRAEYIRIIASGEFISHTLQTLLNTKLWWKLRMKLKKNISKRNALKISGDMRSIAEDEIRNTQKTMRVVTKDSRLGWEPSMGYLTDQTRLSWKIKQLRRVLEKEMPEYLNLLKD